MAITFKRPQGTRVTEADLSALNRLQEVAREQAERLGPYAADARETANQRLLQARGWTAPRLETAAHAVEDTIAPRVADLLSQTAQRIEPTPVKKGWFATRRGGRRLPRPVVIVGIGVLGAAGVYAALRVRQAAQDAEWQQNLDSARDQVRETKDQLATKAKGAQAKLKGTAAEVGDDAKEAKDIAADGTKGAVKDLNGRVAN